MIRRKNMIVLASSIILPIAITLLLLHLSIIDINGIVTAGKEFQYNIISFSAVIAGFLFTGISILISAIDKDRIRRLWDNHYLDNLYRSAMVGICANIASIVLAFISFTCCLSDNLRILFIKIEVVSIIIGLVQFVWCVVQLFGMVRKLKVVH